MEIDCWGRGVGEGEGRRERINYEREKGIWLREREQQYVIVTIPAVVESELGQSAPFLS